MIYNPYNDERSGIYGRRALYHNTTTTDHTHTALSAATGSRPIISDVDYEGQCCYIYRVAYVADRTCTIHTHHSPFINRTTIGQGLYNKVRSQYNAYTCLETTSPPIGAPFGNTGTSRRY